ncbi:MAG TPA: phosphotransferase [Thermodesulfobacteriota bacterium]|nr:phosphotransferase [Thermodesulfobacteriota bacterium]
MPGRGSDRSFFRVKWDSGSAILIHYDPKRTENSYYAEIAVFLQGIKVPAPRVIAHDPWACLLLLEDLGGKDLWSFRNAPWEERRRLYEKTLRALHRLHSFPPDDFSRRNVRTMEGFGPDLYRWEREYFREHFVRDFCEVELDSAMERELEGELSALAGRISGTGQCLVHRDMQSQNVMIRGGEPFFIDFQGMRLGSPFYDLGSLLCDPYVPFSKDQRLELVSFYHGLSGWNLALEAFQQLFHEASAQRLMQALGAYSFLGRKKGLPGFLDHIPPGLKNLEWAASTPSLTRLREVSLMCRRKIEGTIPSGAA